MNSIWIFGDSAGIDFRNTASPIPTGSSMDGRGSCVSISDSVGNVVLYAATLHYLNNDWSGRLFNSQNQIISGCDSIIGYDGYNELIILPKTGYFNQYYLFSVGEDGANNGGCYYSIVDLNLNGGQGAMISQNIQINNNNSGDCLTAVKHGNGRDWWVMNKLSTHTTVSHLNRFFVYLVTGDSIYTPLVQDLGTASDADLQKIIWHPSGEKFMLINQAGYMSEYYFDRCSGTITLSRDIFPEQTSNYNRYFWEGAYSPNGNIFYISTAPIYNTDTAYLLQYDLNASNIQLSCDTLDFFNNPIVSGAVRRGPDNKIYFSRYYNWGFPFYPYPDSIRNYVNENLSVINYPDSLGAACDYQPFSFYLGGKRTYHGLPNNPNYLLGPLTGSVCDSLTSDVPSITLIQSFNIFPNPAKNILYITQSYKELIKRLTVFNSIGLDQPVVTSSIKNGEYIEINTSSLSSGVYFLEMLTEKQKIIKRFIKE